MPFTDRPRGWERTSKRVIARDRGVCWICGGQGADTADHIVPRSRGGGHSDANLRAAHRSCNSQRGTMHPDLAFGIKPRPAKPRRHGRVKMPRSRGSRWR